MVWAKSASARRRARAAGFSQHQLGKHPLQLGGSFVFGPGNVDRFAYLNKTFGDAASSAALLEALGLMAASRSGGAHSK